METASISKLKASLSHYLCIVRTGEEVLVTDRGKAVAKLVPVSQEGPGLATSPEGIGKGRSDPTRIWRDPCFFLERRKVARSRRTRPPSPPRRTGRIAMIFWDASAVLPLCVQEDPSPLVRDLLLGDPAMVVWWGLRSSAALP